MNQNNEDRPILASQAKPPCPRKSLKTITNIGNLTSRIFNQTRRFSQGFPEDNENKQRSKIKILKLKSISYSQNKPNTQRIQHKTTSNLRNCYHQCDRNTTQVLRKERLSQTNTLVTEASSDDCNISKPLEDPYEGTLEQQYSDKFPMTPQQALELFKEKLSAFEQGEILQVKQVYFLGLDASKNEVNLSCRRGQLKVVLKDHIIYRYQIIEVLGEGTFGQVLKCYDFKLKKYVAVKILKKRSYQQSRDEIDILRTLNQSDQEDSKNILHMINSFVYRSHLCISFELLSVNLYEFLRQKDFETINNQVLKRISVQLLNAIKFIHNNNIIHCDLKPENILFKQPNKTGIKVVDFGASCFSFNRVYNYIQSRYYRAPEIILGCPYSFPIDMWSFGCILAEMHLGKPLFPGENEHDQLIRIMGSLGEPPSLLLKRSKKASQYFTVLKRPRIIPNRQNIKIFPKSQPLEKILETENEQFIDLIKKCLEWLPENRIKPEDALSHPWISGGSNFNQIMQRRLIRRNAESAPPRQRNEAIENNKIS